MADQQQTDWMAAAQHKWPNMASSDISGRGPFALVSTCGPYPKVRLFENWNDMRVARDQDCHSAHCRHGHNWIKLSAPEKAKPFYKRPHWASLIEEED